MRIGRKIGSLREWLNGRSAKPFTAVRFRQEPQIILLDKSDREIRFYSYCLSFTNGLNGYICIRNRGLV